MPIGGIERAQLLHLQSADGGHLFHVQVPVHHDGVGLLGQRGVHRTDVVLAVIGHDIVGGDEGRHIAAGLLGQIGINLPVVLLAVGALDGLVDILGAAVVGGDDEVPVAEHLVEVFQVAGGGIG